MTSPNTNTLILSDKDKFKTIFSGLEILLSIAIVLGIFTFGYEFESKPTYYILIVLNLIFYGIMVKVLITGLQSLKKLEQVLPNGALTFARKTQSKLYSLDSSQNPTYKLTYEFEVNEKKYSFKTHSSAKGITLPIPILYNKNDPDTWISLAMLPDSLADRIQDHYGVEGARE